MCVYSVCISASKKHIAVSWQWGCDFCSALQSAAARVDAVVCTLPSRAGRANQLSKSTFNAMNMYETVFHVPHQIAAQDRKRQKGLMHKISAHFSFFFFILSDLRTNQILIIGFLAVQRVVPRQTRPTRLINGLFAALLAFIAFNPFFLIFLLDGTRSE